jgi:hypothetical protein
MLFSTNIVGLFIIPHHSVPIQMNAIPSRMSARSNALARRFRSLKMSAAQVNDTITELRRTSDTTEIIESASCSDVKYAKSAMQINMDIRGMAHVHLNGVP